MSRFLFHPKIVAGLARDEEEEADQAMSLTLRYLCFSLPYGCHKVATKCRGVLRIIIFVKNETSFR
jgi:hypothetical protein